jgi:hypothetical protein
LNEEIGVAEEKEKEETIQKVQEVVEKQNKLDEPIIKVEVHNKDLSHVIDNPMQPPTELSHSVDHDNIYDSKKSPRKLLPMKL